MSRDPPNCNTVMEKVKIDIRYKFLTINAWYIICRFTYVFNDKRKATGRLTEVCYITVKAISLSLFILLNMKVSYRLLEGKQGINDKS